MYANMRAKDPWNSYQYACNLTGARVAARGYWPAHRLQARVI